MSERPPQPAHGDDLAAVLTAHAAPQPLPVAVFVMGQAGSGKSLVMDVVHSCLQRRGKAVRVERDAYKATHPQYDAFLSQDVRTAGVRVREDTYRWQAETETHAREPRYDVVVEEALPDPAAGPDTASRSWP